MLSQEDEEQTPEEEINTMWGHMKNSLLNAAKQIVPTRRKRKQKEWMTEEVLMKMNERKEAKNDTKKYRSLDKEVRKMCERAKETWYNEQCEEIEKLEREHKAKEVHDKVKHLTHKGRRNSGNVCITNKNGDILFEEKDLQERWCEYIGELFDDERGDLPNIEQLEGPTILEAEVEKVINSMKIGKAAGDDGVTTEMLQAIGSLGIARITQLCNKIYDTGYMPDDLKQSTFIPIPKKARAVNCSDFRTISLMSHATKVLLKVILERNKAKIDGEISDNQSGFRRGMGTREGIFNLRTINERYLEKHKDVYICFIDYEKAFDRVKHEKLCEILKVIGMDGKDIRIIAKLYWEQVAVVRTQKGNSRNIKIRKGVRQGCVLSPYLFNLLTEMIFRELDPDWGVSIGGKRMSNLRYADDTALTADSESDLQNIVDKVNGVGKEFGMKMNVKKTKTMVVSRKADPPHVKINIEGQTIEQVSRFMYLGQLITEDGRCDEEIKRRIGQARSAFNNMKGVLCCRKLHLSSRIRLLKCYVWSVLLYGVETWTVNQSSIKRLEAFEMWTIRRMMRISWTEHMSNESVLALAGVRRVLIQTIQKRKLSYFGHVMRHNSVQRDLLEGMVIGKKGRGRPRAQWSHNITDWLQMGFEECKRATMDRKKFRTMTVDLCSRR